MWNLTGKTRRECEAVRDALERVEIHGSASDGREAPLGRLPASQRQHLAACEDCAIFAEELLQVRDLLRSEASGPQPGPFLMAKVMRSIANRELQLQERETQMWAAVPRLAYRLSVVASLALLIAASWLYQKPVQQASVTTIGSEQHSEGLVEGGAPVQDDLLVTTADR